MLSCTVCAPWWSAAVAVPTACDAARLIDELLGSPNRSADPACGRASTDRLSGGDACQLGCHDEVRPTVADSVTSARGGVMSGPLLETKLHAPRRRRTLVS